MELLIEKGAAINTTDGTGETALLKAACKGNLDIVNMLLEHQAEPTMRTREGISPLQCAAANGHVDVVKTLVGGVRL